MTRARIILQVNVDELGNQPDKVIGSFVKAVMFAAQHHPTETGILSWYTKEHADLLFIPRTGNSRPNPRYKIDIDGIMVTNISIVSPQEDYAKEYLM